MSSGPVPGSPAFGWYSSGSIAAWCHLSVVWALARAGPIDVLLGERVLIGTITSALGVLTLLVAGTFFLGRNRNDRRSQFLLIVIGGGFTSVFTGLVVATTGYLAAGAFVVAMAVLYGTLVNFYVRL